MPAVNTDSGSPIFSSYGWISIHFYESFCPQRVSPLTPVLRHSCFTDIGRDFSRVNRKSDLALDATIIPYIRSVRLLEHVFEGFKKPVYRFGLQDYPYRCPYQGEK